MLVLEVEKQIAFSHSNGQCQCKEKNCHSSVKILSNKCAKSLEYEDRGEYTFSRIDPAGSSYPSNYQLICSNCAKT